MVMAPKCQGSNCFLAALSSAGSAATLAFAFVPAASEELAGLLEATGELGLGLLAAAGELGLASGLLEAAGELGLAFGLLDAAGELPVPFPAIVPKGCVVERWPCRGPPVASLPEAPCTLVEGRGSLVTDSPLLSSLGLTTLLLLFGLKLALGLLQ
jgi:hypothetical protein